jgi:hypothetical protein
LCLFLSCFRNHPFVLPDMISLPLENRLVRFPWLTFLDISIVNQTEVVRGGWLREDALIGNP